MATELRWILAALSLLLLTGIWWWGARRSRRMPDHFELRETASPPPAEDLQAASLESPPVARDWGVSPLEPLSIRTAEFELPTMVAYPAETGESDEHFDDAATVQVYSELTEAWRPATPLEPVMSSAPAASAPAPAAPAPPSMVSLSKSSDSASTGSNPQGPNLAHTQHIVGVRVCAAGDARWSGTDLLAALEQHGLAYGRYQVFHRRQSDGRTLFCAASLVEPGTFDLARMPEDRYLGLTLFAVLPGPAEPLTTFDSMLQTAGELASTLQGKLQDSTGAPLTASRAQALRDEVARFQTMLNLHLLA